jgi:hypothetical protein
MSDEASFFLCLASGAILLCIGYGVHRAYLFYKHHRPNRRVRQSAWPRRGYSAPQGFWADSAKRPTTECAGKVK